MGSNFQFIDIIFFAMVAAFLVLRLRGVLGRRDGHEKQLRNPFKPQKKEQASEHPESPDDDYPDDNVVPLSGRDDPDFADAAEKDRPPEPPDDDDPLAQGLFKIHSADPNFNAEEFISGARIAFEVIVGAYAAGDAAALKPLLSAEVYAIAGGIGADNNLEQQTQAVKNLIHGKAVFIHAGLGLFQDRQTLLAQQMGANEGGQDDGADGFPKADDLADLDQDGNFTDRDPDQDNEKYHSHACSFRSICLSTQ